MEGEEGKSRFVIDIRYAIVNIAVSNSGGIWIFFNLDRITLDFGIAWDYFARFKRNEEAIRLIALISEELGVIKAQNILSVFLREAIKFRTLPFYVLAIFVRKSRKGKSFSNGLFIDRMNIIKFSDISRNYGINVFFLSKFALVSW